MARVLRIVQLTFRLSGLLLIVLGALIWAGQSSLAQPHAALGMLFVLALWCLAALSFRTRAGMALGFRAVIWGFIVFLFGIMQVQMWPGPLHVYIRIAHLIIGLIAIAIGEMLGARIRRAHHGSTG